MKISVIILILYSAVIAQDTTDYKWRISFGIGGGNGSLTGKAFQNTDLPDSIKEDMANEFINIYVGRQIHYGHIYVELFTSVIEDLPNSSKPWIGGEFNKLEIGYSKRLFLLEWLSFSAGLNLNGISMSIKNTGKTLFTKSGLNLSYKCNALVVLPGRKYWPHDIKPMKHILIIGTYKDSLTPIRNKESSVSVGFNLGITNLAFSYGIWEARSMYKSNIYKLIWSGPIQLLP